jgi:DNA-binding IclR family transcriptional regulator
MRGIEVHWWAVGGTLPLNCGGAPKLLLAYQPDDQIDRLLDQSMDQMSPHSITDRAILRQKLALIRQRGWECAVDDVTLGMTALAVPVLDRDGAPVCVVSMAGLTPQMMQDGKPVFLDKLQATAARVRHDLGIHD